MKEELLKRTVKGPDGVEFEVEPLRDYYCEAAPTVMPGAYIKIVEDAARLLYHELNGDARIRDFQVACAHLESLHSHDAVSVICKGVPGGFTADFMDFSQLVC